MVDMDSVMFFGLSYKIVVANLFKLKILRTEVTKLPCHCLLYFFSLFIKNYTFCCMHFSYISAFQDQEEAFGYNTTPCYMDPSAVSPSRVRIYCCLLYL